MLEKKGAEWGKEVRIIGLSIDQGKDVVAKHVESKGWTGPEHFWRAKSDCSEVYGVKGVPHVMLIDKSGTIVFKGHPATRPNLEKDLDDLKAGVALTGEGIAAAPAGGDDETKPEGIPEGFKEVDAEAITKEVDSFKEVLEGLQKDATLKE